MRRLLPLTLLLSGAVSAQVTDHPLQITVRADEVTCMVLGQVMPCSDVTAYLLDTLHIGFDRPLAVSPEGADPTEARGRSLATALSTAAASPLVFALICLIHGDELGIPPPKVLGFFAVLSFIIAAVVGVAFLAQRRWFAMAPNNRWRGP
jgi:hypothetical protein